MPRPATTPVTMASRPQTSWPCPSKTARIPAPIGSFALDDLARDAGARLVPRLAAVERDELRLLVPERERLVERACCLVVTCSPGGTRLTEPITPRPRARAEVTRPL